MNHQLEKLLILQLFHYFSNYTLLLNGDVFDEMQAYNIDFIDDLIPLDLYTEEEQKSMILHIKKHKYRWIGGQYFKYIGFKALSNFIRYGERDEYKELEVIDYIYNYKDVLKIKNEDGVFF